MGKKKKMEWFKIHSCRFCHGSVGNPQENPQYILLQTVDFYFPIEFKIRTTRHLLKCMAKSTAST